MTSIEDVYEKLNKLANHLNVSIADKSKDELDDLIDEAINQIQEMIDDVREIKYELDEMDIKFQNIIRNV